MALAWDPVEVAEIAHATRLPSNQVSAQLRALVKAGLVVEAAGQPKRKSYLLADRFFNIQYLMRHGRAARNRFDWFVAIVRLIFPDHAQTLAKTAREAAGCGSEGLRDARDLMRGALLRAGSDEARRQLLAATLRETWDNETVATLSEWLDLESAKRLLPEVEIVDFFCRMPHALRVELGYEPLRATWWFALTDVLEEKESWAMAEAAYHKAIELDPKYGRAWTFLGNLLKLKLGRHAEAESAYRKAIQIGSKDPYPWICLGYLLSEQDGRYKEAEVALRNSIQLNSNDPYPWFCLGRLLSSDRFGRYDEAEAAFRKAIELDPKDAAVWTCLGNVLRFHLCRDADAERAYRTASELNPKDEYPWIGLGSLLSSQPTGRYPEAKAAFLNAIELNPDRSYPWAALADILNTKSNRTDEPRSYAMKALRIEPDSEYSRIVFLRLCGENGEDWRAVLPGLAAFCGANPKSEEVFEFTVDGFLRLARLSTPGEALAMIAALPDPAPFETLADAFRAYANVDHLQRLAPERRTLAMELLKRLPARK